MVQMKQKSGKLVPFRVHQSKRDLAWINPQKLFKMYKLEKKVQVSHQMNSKSSVF